MIHFAFVSTLHFIPSASSLVPDTYYLLGVNNVLSALYKTNRKVCGVGSNCIYYLAKDNPTNQRRLRNAGALELMESICQISNIESGFYQNEALTLLKNYEPDLSFRPAQGKNVDLQAPSKVKSFVAPKVKSKGSQQFL